MTKFVEHMELFSLANNGFKHVMLTDSNGTCAGFLSQMSVMRDNFERVGHCVSLDALKLEINTLLWNHKAVTLINELGMVCLGLEGIVCTEILLGYTAMINFTLENLPRGVGMKFT